MAGTSTKVGFAGGRAAPAPEGEPPAEARSAPTIFGRDQHLQLPQSVRELAATMAPTPVAITRTTKDVPLTKVDPEVTPEPETSHHSGKTGFPGIVRFFWRWN